VRKNHTCRVGVLLIQARNHFWSQHANDIVTYGVNYLNNLYKNNDFRICRGPYLMFGYNRRTQKMFDHAELIYACHMLRISMNTAIRKEEYMLNFNVDEGASIKEALFLNQLPSPVSISLLRASFLLRLSPASCLLRPLSSVLSLLLPVTCLHVSCLLTFSNTSVVFCFECLFCMVFLH
jgi:hypothetical protein